MMPPRRGSVAADQHLAPDERDTPAEAPADRTARLAALRRLLQAPAPDLPALSLKIDFAVDDAAWELTGAETSLAALKADGRRFAHRG